jgi:hypothetical protein
MGDIILFPRQSEIHWQGRALTHEELAFLRDFLLSVARRVRVKRIQFTGISFYGNNTKEIIDQLAEKKVITPEERDTVYRKLNS